jgi:hypothetical protein
MREWSRTYRHKKLGNLVYSAGMFHVVVTLAG